MNAENFCYWLQGFMELSPKPTLNTRQIEIIRNHLTLVFDKITPNKPWKPSTSEIDKMFSENNGYMYNNDIHASC